MMNILPKNRPGLLLAILLTCTAFVSASPAGLTYSALPTTLPSGETARAVVRVEPVSDEVRRDYRLDPFYKKSASVDGVLIIASDKVSDYAVLECAWTLDHLLSGRTMARDALVKAKVRVGILAVAEYTMDIPENRHMGNGVFNDRRSRGLGGLPLATCAEENLLSLRGDPYTAENITIHEFSHTVASAIQKVNPHWYERLRDAYDKAMAAGTYGKSYAATNEQEYWAEGAQAWFDCANPHNSGGNANREQLKARDPQLAGLLTEVYGDGAWRYCKVSSRNRQADDLAHLKDFNRDAMAIFDFENSPRIKAAKK